MSAQETKVEWNAGRSAIAWANFRNVDAGTVSKRWMDSDAEKLDGQDAVDGVSKIYVYDDSVEAPVELCPPPPPPVSVLSCDRGCQCDGQLGLGVVVPDRAESGAFAQLVECQNSTIAVLSASLQTLCLQSSGGMDVSSGRQADLIQIYSRCQIYIQDRVGSAAKNIVADLAD